MSRVGSTTNRLSTKGEGQQGPQGATNCAVPLAVTLPKYPKQGESTPACMSWFGTAWQLSLPH